MIQNLLNLKVESVGFVLPVGVDWVSFPVFQIQSFWVGKAWNIIESQDYYTIIDTEQYVKAKEILSYRAEYHSCKAHFLV